MQVGSALAYRSIPLRASYCGAKHAVKGSTESLRCELLHDKSKVKVTMVHLTGTNTPQFAQVATTLRRYPRPVPPIYQPELAARAIVWAAEHPRREVFVGGPTPLAIWAGRVLPGLFDHYLARASYEAQQTDIAIAEGRPSYLWEPLPGDAGAHGIFDAQAHSRSIQFELVSHRCASVAGIVGLAALALGKWRRRPR